MSAPEAWHPDPEDEAWLIEEVDAHPCIGGRKSSWRGWSPRTVWEPIIRRGLLRGEWVRDGSRERAWAGGLMLAERWADGYVTTAATTPDALQRLLKIAAITAAEQAGRALVSWPITVGGR